MRLRERLADRLRFLRLLSEIPSAGGEKAAFVAVVAALKEVVDGHHCSAFYGRIGLPCVDVFLPGEGWLGVDSELAKLIARHHHEHPFAGISFSAIVRLHTCAAR